MFLIVFTSLLVLVFFSFYLKRKRDHQLWKNLGIPGPDPHWLFGNLSGRSDLSRIKTWQQQYGDVYGYYEGSSPVIVVSDPDMIQEIFVRNFSNFNGRRQSPLQDDPEGERVHMFNAVGKRWKKLRTSVNPAFSEVKMKAMYKLIKVSVDRLMEKFADVASEDRAFDMYDRYKRMTLDVIAECAFGVATSSQDRTSKIFEDVKYLFDTEMTGVKPLYKLGITIPELRWLARKLHVATHKWFPETNRFQGIIDQMTQVIEMRKNDPSSRRVDILQLMLDAEIGDEAVSESQKALTTMEIQLQSTIFLLAGYETTSTALIFISYCLATNPEVQKQLQDEVDSVYEELGEEAESSYDALNSLSYMNKVIHETLRMYPIANTAVTRYCTESIKIDKWFIPKGALVQANALAMHDNPEIWGPTDPKVFDPHRFDEGLKRHPAVWIPFGIGPRFCVGMRFAMMEIRSTLLQLMRNYTIKTCEETKLNLRYVPTLSPKGSLMMKLEKRNHL